MRFRNLALAGVLVLGLGACSAEEPAPTDRGDAEAQSDILQPGRPGEGNETLDPGATVESAPTNEADVTFMQMMIPHHAQALEMTELAQTRARDEQVTALARRIKGAQGPEITAMSGWLQSRGLEVPTAHDDHAGHGGGAEDDEPLMPGMLSGQQMADLADARGARFDRLFLAGMIEHHQGAIDMAAEVMQTGSDVLALELAADIATGQLAEIGRMQDVRRSL